jgi:zinc protease
MIALRCFALVLMLSLLPPALAQKLPPGVTAVSTLEGVSEYRLANGLQVLLYPDPSKPTATVNVTYLVGSRHEGYGETGMAHLLEHLIFKGSTKFPKPDAEFSRRGFRNNGTTWFDRTNYFSTFQASDENLRWALAWKADAMVNSFIAKKDLDSEMTVVRNEYEAGENNPTNVMFKRLLSVSFDWHNYGNSTIGNRSDIENVAIENLRAFYKRYYQPDNAILVVAGKFDSAKTVGWIAETFGKLPKPTRKLPPLWTVEPTQDGERSFVVRRKADIQLAIVAYKIPSSLHPDTDALNAAAEVLANTPNGRLHKELVERGLAAQVFSFAPQTRDPGLVIFGAAVKKGDSLEKARDRLVELVETSLTTPATEAELTRYRQDAETAFERTYNDPEQFGVSLSEFVAVGDWRLFFLARDRALAMQAADISSAAQKYFRRDNRVVGMFVSEDAPQRAQIAAAPAVSERLKDFKPRVAVAAGESFDPSPANIDKRTRRVAIGDLNLALLPKKTRGETVNVAIATRWGDEKSLTGQSVAALLAEQMVMRGTSKYSRQQIADEFTRLKITGNLREFQTTRSNLPDALRLAAHVMREAGFPAAEFDLLKREMLTGMQAQLSDPSERARDALRAHFNTYPAGDPRYYLPLAERIDAIGKITVAEVKKFHAAFWGGARGEISIVGDFDDKAAEVLAREVFASWKSATPYGRVVTEPRPVKTERIVINTPDKENAVIRGRMNFTMRDDDADYPAVLLANTVLGGGSGLANRLIDRLRQKDGLSYGAGSSLLVNNRDRAASLQLAALVAPQNVQRAEAAIREEFAKWVKDGVTAKEVEDAKNGMLQERTIERSQDAVVARGWTSHIDAGRSWKFSEGIDTRLRALTAAEVNAAIKRHFDPAQLTLVLAGDTAKGFQ